MLKSFLFRGVCAALLSWAAVPGAASVVANGGFETPDLGTGTVFRFRDPAAVPGWETTDTAIEIWANGFNNVPSFEGDQHVEVNARSFGTLYQDVSGIAAGAELSFGFAHRARRGTDVVRFSLTDLGGDGAAGGGDDRLLFSQDYSATTASWVVNGSSGLAPILAQGGVVRLGFTPVSTGSNRASIGNFIDAVSLEAELSVMPVPAGLPLFVSGLAALVWLRRRRRAA